MGVDLKLLIVDGRLDTWGFSHTVLEFDRYYDLYDRLNEVARTIPGFELHSYVATIPDGSWMGEKGYGTVSKTPYEEKLTYVSAEEFNKAVENCDLRGNQYALAAVAYIRCLKPDTLIGLYYN